MIMHYKGTIIYINNTNSYEKVTNNLKKSKEALEWWFKIIINYFSYNYSIQFDTQNQNAWNNKGIALYSLGEF